MVTQDDQPQEDTISVNKPNLSDNVYIAILSCSYSPYRKMLSTSEQLDDHTTLILIVTKLCNPYPFIVLCKLLILLLDNYHNNLLYCSKFKHFDYHLKIKHFV